MHTIYYTSLNRCAFANQKLLTEWNGTGSGFSRQKGEVWVSALWSTVETVAKYQQSIVDNVTDQ